MVAATDDGVVVVDTVTIDATVTAIDLNKRKLTLTSADGGKTTYKARPEMVNFDQLQIGDSVSAVVTEAVAVYIGASAPPDAVAAGGVMLAPVDHRRGVRARRRRTRGSEMTSQDFDEKLAEALDALSHGFARTESGVEPEL